MSLRHHPRVAGVSTIGLWVAVVMGSVAVVPASANAQARVTAPDSLTDAEFWQFFTTMSEPDGYFLSENFVSNEVSFQDVIPTLQRSLTRNGVYLGVGPEQNFTYIANLAPKMAVIFDIRRQNAMQHLMYKALFELSATRAEFVSRLFSRPSVARLGPAIAVKALFDSATAALPSDSAYQANLTAIVELLMIKHGFTLPLEDIESIRHVYNVFFKAGPEVNYGYRSGNPPYVRSTYPTYGMLQTATNADTVQTAFLASEEHYRAVRSLQRRNLIVPVVGDFGGPAAIRSVAKWLREREMTVTAFYVSNVEQYLFRDGGASDRFYSNVSALPLDSTSRFIRSVPRRSMIMTMPAMTFRPDSIAIRSQQIAFTTTTDGRGNVITQTFRDSAGVTLVQTTIDSSASRRNQAQRDSAGLSTMIVTTNRVTRDSTGRDSTVQRMLVVRDSINILNSQWQIAAGPRRQVIMGGLLTSGLASIGETLQKHFLGELKSYNAVVTMTKVDDWR
jgi:hypothetical protein